MNDFKDPNEKGIPGMKWGIRDNFFKKDSPETDIPSTDAVNYPAHYTNGVVECIDAIQSSMSRPEFLGYLKGNVQKYIWRYTQKDSPIQDLEKAKWYLERLLKELKNDNN